jgi:hypothetical protein
MMAGLAQRLWNARQRSSGAHFAFEGVSGRHSMAIGRQPTGR